MSFIAYSQQIFLLQTPVQRKGNILCSSIVAIIIMNCEGGGQGYSALFIPITNCSDSDQLTIWSRAVPRSKQDMFCLMTNV